MSLQGGLSVHSFHKYLLSTYDVPGILRLCTVVPMGVHWHANRWGFEEEGCALFFNRRGRDLRGSLDRLGR